MRNGFQHLFLYHRPSKKFVPLAKLRSFAASDGNLVVSDELPVVPGRKSPEDPIPIFRLEVEAEEIAYVEFSGPRTGEYLVADEVRFIPLNGKRTTKTLSSAAQTVSAVPPPDEDTSQRDPRSLKRVVGDRFKLGVGIGHRVVANQDDVDLIRKHFQIITPENCMKPWPNLQSQPNVGRNGIPSRTD